MTVIRKNGLRQIWVNVPEILVIATKSNLLFCLKNAIIADIEVIEIVNPACS